MSISQNTLQLLEQARAEGPSYYKALSDEGLYYELRKSNKVSDDNAWDSIDKKFGYSAQPQETPQDIYGREDDMGILQQYAGYWIDDESYDWVKAAYNRSLTGNLEQLITGNQRYNVDETDFNLLEDISASFLSFLMPLDIFSMWTGGVAGKALSKGLAKGMANKANSQVLKKLPKSVSKWGPEETSTVMSTLSAGQKMLTGAVGQAPALALYEGAMGGVQAGIHGDDVLGGITYGVIHGGVLGGITGAVGTGLGGLQAKLLQKGKKDALTGFEQFRAYGAYGVPGQILSESSIFTGFGAAERLHHAIKNGEDVDGNEILRDFYHNVGLFGFLKGKQKIMQYGSDVINDIKKATRMEIAKKQDIENKNKDAKDKVKDNINEDPNISSRNKDEINTLLDKDNIAIDVNLKERTKELDRLDAELKTFLEILNTGAIKDKESARKILTKIKKNLVETDGVIDNYLKEKGGNEADVVYASNLEKRARKAKEEFNKIDAEIDSKFDAYIKSKGEQANAVKPFGFKTIKEAKENSMTLSEKEIINEANKYGIDAEGKLGTKESRDVIIDRIYQSKLSEVEVASQIGKARAEEIGAAVAPTIKKTLGKHTDPKGRELNITEAKYKKLESETGKTLEVDYVKGSAGDITKKTIQEIKKITDDPLISIAVEHTFSKIKSSSTAKQYKPTIVNFIKWLKDKKIDINNVAERDIVTFFKETKGKDLKELNPAIVSPIKNIFQWMSSKEGFNLAEDPSIGLAASFTAYNASRERRKKDIPEPKKFNKDISKLSEDVLKDAPSKEVGDSANIFVKIVHESGIRNQEFFLRDAKDSPIKVSDIKHIKNGKVVEGIDLSKGAKNFIAMREVSTKNKKERNVPISLETAKAIDAFVKKYKIKKNEDLINDKYKKPIRKIVNEKLKKLYKKAEIDDVRDVLHQEGYFFIKDFNEKDVRLLNYILGHDMTAIERVYGKDAPTSKIIEAGFEAMNKIWNQRKTEVKEKFQKVTPELQQKIDTGIEVQQKQKEYFESLPAYKKLVINLGQKLGKAKGETVLGKIRGHVIKIAEGKVKLDTVPHEVSHYVVDVLKQFGTGKDKSLIKRGVNLFAKDLKRGEIKTVDSKGKETIKKFKESKEEFRERKEELLVQRVGELASGQITNRTMVSKFKNWVKAVNARMKEFFGIANKDDVAFILSRRVVKGNIPKGKQVENFINGLKDHFQTVVEEPSLVKSYNKEIHRKENELIEAGIEGGRKLLDEVRVLLGIEPSGTGRKATDTSIADYSRYLKELETLSESMPNIKKKETMLEIHAEKYNVNKEELSNLVISLGEPSGIASNMSAKAQAYLRQYITNHGKKTVPKELSVGETAQLSGEKLSWIEGVGKAFLPAYYVIQKHGGNAGQKLADRILGFDVALHTEFKGPGDVHIYNLKKLLGGKKSEFVRHFDIERSKALLKAEKEGKTFGKKMSLEERQFIKDMQIEGTNANLAYKEHKEITKFYWEALGKEVKKITNKAEYENFLKEFNEKFVVDYHTRKVTKEAKEHFEIEKTDSKHIQKIVDENIKRAASQEAIKYTKNLHKKSANITTNHSKNMVINPSYKKTFQNRYKENLNSEKLKIEIADNIMFMLTQQHSKVKNSFLLDRGPLLPEYIEVTKRNGQKKIIQTYESSISKSIDPYVAGMSKYLATLRFFPEYTGLGGRHTIGSSKLLQLETIVKNSELGKYAKMTIERMIGVHKENEGHARLASVLGATAHLSAAAGLSSPTSGIKNFFIGIPRSIASFGLWNTSRGIIKLFDTNTWDKAREKGTLEFGSKTMELPTARFTDKGMLKMFSMENLFKYVNLMTFTENVNRMVSMEAGKLYFTNNLQMLRGKTGVFGKANPKTIKRLFRDQYKLPESEIKFLEKGDLSTIEGTKRLESIHRHVEFYSHASAQGTTSIGHIPLWASSSLGKPLTLFQRMAYSTTFDSYRNYFKPAIKHGNVAPLAKAFMAHTVSGMALFSLYQWLFDKEPVKSAGTSGDKMFMYLHRSEFLGLLGSTISPYDDGTFQSIADPVIIRNLTNGGKEFMRFVGGTETFADATNNFAKKSLVLYAQADTYRKVKGNKAYSEMLVMNNWEKQFKGEFGITPSSNEDYSVRTVYYRKLKEALWEGKESEIKKQYISAYNYIVTDLMDNRPGTITAKQAHKLAIKQINSSIKYMAPVMFTKKGKYVVTPRREYLEWVEKNFGKKGLKRIKAQEYQFRLRKKMFDKVSKDKNLWLEKSVFSDQFK